MRKACNLFLFILLAFSPMVQSSAKQLEMPWDHWDSESFIGNSPYVMTGDKTTPYSCGIADTEGNVLVPPQYYVSETRLSFLLCNAQDQWGFFDKQHGIFHEPKYDAIYDFFCDNPDAPILVGLDGEYSYIDRITGERVIEQTFTGYCEYSEFIRGYAVAVNQICSEDEIQYTHTLIDLDGNVVTFPEGIDPFGFVQKNGLIRIRDTHENMLFGIGNTRGEVLLSPQFHWISDYQYGYASARWQEWWGHIDEHPQVVVPPRFILWDEDNTGYYFQSDGTATFVADDGTYTTIDANGNIIKQHR